MKTAYSFMFLLAFTLGAGTQAFAEATHEGKINLELVLINAKGKAEKVASKDGEYRLDWKAKKCEAKVDGVYAYCDLDLSKDLVNAKGDLIMHSMPQAHFDTKTIDALISMIGRSDDKTRGSIDAILRDSQAQRTAGFDLPFYTCGNEYSGNPDCLKTGKDLLLFNAFKGNSYVVREINLSGSRLGAQKLVFKVKISGIKAHGASFNIIGNNAAGNFGTH